MSWGMTLGDIIVLAQERGNDEAEMEVQWHAKFILQKITLNIIH